MTSPTFNPDWNCSVVAWGNPSDPVTFSGFSRALANTMRERHVLRREFSLKQIHFGDIFGGAFGLKIQGLRPRLQVRRSWMWSERTSRALQHRLEKSLDAAGDRGSFLQIGTLVEIDPRFGSFAVLSDMTIPQAYREAQFAVGNMSRVQYDAAVAVQGRVLHAASHAFTLTDWARQSMIDDFGLAPSKVTTVYMGSVVAAPPDETIVKNPQQILFVGIDWQRKGGPQLVEGFRLLRQRLPQAQLVIAGCSPHIDCPGVRIEGYLHPRDPKARRRLENLYRESACFALMSDFEPLGNVMIEAYAMGLPVVAFNSGSRAEIIRDGQTGLLCPDREPATIADALYRLLSDPSACQAMGQRAKQRVDEEFNWDRVVTRIAEQMSPSHQPSIERASQPAPTEVLR